MANFADRAGDPQAGEHPLCALAMDGLRAALDDLEPVVRAAAIEALGACGRSEHQAAIAALAADGSAPALVVVEALRALARLGPTDPELLRGALAHPDPEVAKAVVAAAVRVPGEAGRGLLRAALANGRWDVRLAVAQAIARARRRRRCGTTRPGRRRPTPIRWWPARWPTRRWALAGGPGR